MLLVVRTVQRFAAHARRADQRNYNCAPRQVIRREVKVQGVDLVGWDGEYTFWNIELQTY